MLTQEKEHDGVDLVCVCVCLVFRVRLLAPFEKEKHVSDVENWKRKVEDMRLESLRKDQVARFVLRFLGWERRSGTMHARQRHRLQP